MIMCPICGTWMMQKYVTDKGMVYYYDYCPKCNPPTPELKVSYDNYGTRENYRPGKATYAAQPPGGFYR